MFQAVLGMIVGVIVGVYVTIELAPKCENVIQPAMGQTSKVRHHR